MTSRSTLLYLAIAAWLVLVAAGLAVVGEYEATAGSSGAAPSRLPEGTRVAPEATDEGRHVLMLFVHPHCPCSRATIGELAIVMTRCQGRVDADVHFYTPSRFKPGWEKTTLWRSAAAIPGVTLHVDLDGQTAERFGARVSGHVVLYDASGELAFSGGITASRGHSGDSVGRSAVVDSVHGRGPAISAAPVYGCALFVESPDPDSAASWATRESDDS